MQEKLGEASRAEQLAKSLAQGEGGVTFSLQRMIKHCAREFGCAMAFITAVDETSQYILASVGVDPDAVIPDLSFCRHALDSRGTFRVVDASEDERFRDSPAVKGPPHIRSYLGDPILDPQGRSIVTISVVDPRPNLFTDSHVGMLDRYARGAEDLLRLHSLHEKARQHSLAIRKKNAQLADANRMFREAEKTAKFGAWELDIETQQLTWTDGVYAIHGIAEPRPMTVEEAIAFYEEGDREHVRQSVAKAIETGEPFEMDANLVSEDGVVKRVRSKGELIPRSDSFPARLTGIFKDVTDSYRAEVALRHAAEHDSLTELYNRYAFDKLLRDRLSQAQSDDEYLYLLLLDLDGFKDVNDTLGHMVGDVVLEETGRRIAEIAPPGCFAARWGGDEFAIVLPKGMGGDEAKAVGAALLDAICQRTKVSGHLIDVSATAGLVSSAAGINAKELVRRADTALFHGKRREPGKVHFYTSTVEQKNLARQRAISEVRGAIHDRRLFAGYQPIVDLASREIIGFEALMRLHTADGRRLTATEVLPALLDPKLSREVCRAMLGMVSQEASRLENCAPGFDFVSVNASEADLLSENFAERFAQTMLDARVDLSRLTLEVTETVLLVDNAMPMQRVLLDLRERGVRIALDDFGTGYSSLSHLRDFPIDKVKIDRSFVRAIDHEHQSRTIVQALIGMARSMEIDVIAEGVETEAQRSILLQMGCNYGQGFLFGAAQDIGRLELGKLNNEAASLKGLSSAA